MNLRGTLQLAVLGAVSAGVLGCRHKPQVAPPPPLPPAVNMPLVPAPEPANPPQVQKEPVPAVPLPNASVQPKPKKTRKKPPVTDLPAAAGTTAPAPTAPITAPPTAAPAVTAPPGPPPASVIGSLTAGGDAAPQEKQKAADAIAAAEKSLSAIPSATSDEQRESLNRVRTFIRQAQDALNSGDAEGATQLATKAKVLLDDLAK